jgi:hypothetical protein
MLADPVADSGPLTLLKDGTITLTMVIPIGHVETSDTIIALVKHGLCSALTDLESLEEEWRDMLDRSDLDREADATYRSQQGTG